MLHDMQVPHLHELLLALVDVSELVDHHHGLGLEPLGVVLVLGVGVHLLGVHREAGDGVVVQAVVAGDERAHQVPLLLQLHELREAGLGALRVAHQDLGHVGAHLGPVAGEGQASGLLDHVVRRPGVRAVVRLVDGHLDARAVRNGLQAPQHFFKEWSFLNKDKLSFM